MAKTELARSENVAGDFFVDDSCIDCDTCRWMAPEIFDRAGGMSRVHRQPVDAGEGLRALQALVSCPTASIGTREKHAMQLVIASMPVPVDGDVYHCGYHHEASFGAASYLIVRPEGNVLVDSPRFTRPLVRRLEELGGVSILWLSHVDDVADHERFHAHFGCERILHRDDARGDLRGLERLIEGQEPVRLAEDLLMIPVPGHTRGSSCLLHRETHLFSGDHVAWSARLGHVHAFRSACWYDWDVQIESMQRLGEHPFQWILPGHGRRCRFPPQEMKVQMRRCIEWMRG